MGRFDPEAISSRDELAAELDRIYAEATGLKHVWHPGGWPFSDPSFNEFVVNYKSPKIIYMYRGNLLQRLVSAVISEQSDVWHPESAEAGQAAIFSRNFDPIEPARVERFLANERKHFDFLNNLREHSASRVYVLTYESLYHPRLSLQDKLDKLGDIMRFLEIEPFKDEVFEVIRELNPVHSKLNNEETYSMIPNAREIDRLFGSEANGYIFEQTTDRTAESAYERYFLQLDRMYRSALSEKEELARKKEELARKNEDLFATNAHLCELMRRPVHRIANRVDRLIQRTQVKDAGLSAGAD
jgi:hypothetical protein